MEKNYKRIKIINIILFIGLITISTLYIIQSINIKNQEQNTYFLQYVNEKNRNDEIKQFYIVVESKKDFIIKSSNFAIQVDNKLIQGNIITGYFGTTPIVGTTLEIEKDKENTIIIEFSRKELDNKTYILFYKGQELNFGKKINFKI